MFFFSFLKILYNKKITYQICDVICLLNYLLFKEVRNPNLGLWVSQSLDGITSQKYMTVIRESIIKSGAPNRGGGFNPP